MTNRYTLTLLDYFDKASKNHNIRPLILGGFNGADGGGGGPPGGFIGFLPQTRIAYDITEAELSGFLSPTPYNSSGILVSGSLLDNLNHIRYRLAILEALGGISSGVINSAVVVEDDGTPVSSNITVLDFGSNLNVTLTASNEVTIDAAGGGHTIEDEGTPLTQRTNLNFVGTGVQVTDDSGNDATVVTVNISGAATGVDIKDDTSLVVSGATVLNFGTGLDVTNDGGGQVTIDTNLTNGHIIRDSSSAFTQRANLKFVGSGVAVSDDVGSNSTVVTISGAVSGGGHTILNNGTPMTDRAKLNFIGFTVTDDSINNETEVTGKYYSLNDGSLYAPTSTTGPYQNLLLKTHWSGTKAVVRSTTMFGAQTSLSMSNGNNNLGLYDASFVYIYGDSLTADANIVNITNEGRQNGDVIMLFYTEEFSPVYNLIIVNTGNINGPDLPVTMQPGSVVGLLKADEKWYVAFHSGTI